MKRPELCVREKEINSINLRARERAHYVGLHLDSTFLLLLSCSHGHSFIANKISAKKNPK